MKDHEERYGKAEAGQIASGSPNRLGDMAADRTAPAPSVNKDPMEHDPADLTMAEAQAMIRELRMRVLSARMMAARAEAQAAHEAVVTAQLHRDRADEASGAATKRYRECLRKDARTFG